MKCKNIRREFRSGFYSHICRFAIFILAFAICFCCLSAYCEDYVFSELLPGYVPEKSFVGDWYLQNISVKIVELYSSPVIKMDMADIGMGLKISIDSEGSWSSVKI